MSETQLFLGIGLILCAAFIGKLFCSYICPVGSVTEWLGRLGDRLHVRREISAKFDGPLRILKYGLLFLSVYFTMTSSELFCRKFDPYFASTQLFGNADIVLYYAIPAFVIAIAGSIFFRLFWCRFLCPLGALSNIFGNIASSGGVLLIFFAANIVGAKLSFVWLLAGLTVSGLINEVFYKRAFLLPVPKIRRNDAICTNCSNCDSSCPQGIKISQEVVVSSIDCNLCSDCVSACPLKSVITVNGSDKLKYLAPVSGMIIIALALAGSAYFEFTTVSLRWGQPAVKESAIYQTNLKNINCYGSSMSLAGVLGDIPGITGLDTYAKSHKVKIYYDPAVISETAIKRTLFNSAKVELIPTSGKETGPVGVFSVGIMGLFDEIDLHNLQLLLKTAHGVIGYETQYGEPVQTTIYYDPKIIAPAGIIERLNSRRLPTTSGNSIDIGFRPQANGSPGQIITMAEYKQRIFKQFDDIFSGYQESDKNTLAVFRFGFLEWNDNCVTKLELLSSALSGSDGILRFSVRYDDAVIGFVVFDPSKTGKPAIASLLSGAKLKYYISDTETEEEPNPFKWSGEEKVCKFLELKL